MDVVDNVVSSQAHWSHAMSEIQQNTSNFGHFNEDLKSDSKKPGLRVSQIEPPLDPGTGLILPKLLSFSSGKSGYAFRSPN